MTRAAPSGATPLRDRRGEQVGTGHTVPLTVLLRTCLLCRARVKRTVGAGAGPTSVAAGEVASCCRQAAALVLGTGEGVLVPTGGRQQVRPPRPIPTGRGCWWPAWGVYWPPPDTSTDRQEATGTSQASAGPTQRDYWPTAGWRTAAPDRAGHGPGGPGRPGHQRPRQLPPGAQRAGGAPWLPGLRALLAGRRPATATTSAR